MKRKKTAEVEVLEADFADVMGIITRRRARALMSVNVENLLTNWEIGAFLSARVHTGSWSTAVVGRLADYIKRNDPTLKGYGKSSLYNMALVYDAFSDDAFLSLLERHSALISLPEDIFQSVNGKSSLPSGQLRSKMPAVAGQKNSADFFQPVIGKSFPAVLALTSYTNLVLICNHCTSAQEKLFYIVHAARQRLKTRELLQCLEEDAYTAILGSDRRNYSGKLRKLYPTSPLVIKDTAFLDYLSLPEKHREKKLRSEIVTHIRDFILEMGKDFLFVDQEYTLPVGGEDFHSDLLFYHRGLQCLVAFELKSRKFRPQDLGQLEFYLEALDRDVKKENENPSIGILLCKQANQVVVEYALSRTMSPVMVAQYKKQLIPKEVLQRTFEEYLALPETIPEADGDSRGKVKKS